MKNAQFIQGIFLTTLLCIGTSRSNFELRFRWFVTIERAVSAKTSHLWTHIDLDRVRPFDYLQICVERGLPAGLDVVLSFLQPAQTDAVQWSVSTRLLLSHFHRWQSVSCEGIQETFVNMLSQVSDVQNRRIRHVDFYGRPWGAAGDLTLWDSFWTSLTGLRSLALGETLLPWSPAFLINALTRLHHLHLHLYPNPSRELLDLIFGNCSELQSFKLVGFESSNDIIGNADSQPQDSKTRRIILPALRSLSLTAVSRNYLHQIFSTLAVPQLSALSIDEFGVDCIPIIIIFINASPLSLKELELQGLDNGGDDVTYEGFGLHSLLKRSTSLEILHLSHLIDPNVWRALAPEPCDTQCSCPNLREIHLHDAYHFDPLAIADTIESRARHGLDRTPNNGVRQLDLVSVTIANPTLGSWHPDHPHVGIAIERPSMHAKEVKWKR
jgi:hypothetical protein